MADCRIDGTVRSGSQQQWFTRNSSLRGWRGANWNMMFMGVDGAPPTTFPQPPNTTLPADPLMRENLSVYANFTADPSIVLESAIEAPRAPGIRFSHVTTISLGGGKGTIAHLINEVGEAAGPGAIRQTLLRYPPKS